MPMTSISVLGSTGSIGTNTLDVIRHFQAEREFEIVALTGMNNTELLARQAIEFNAQIAVTANESQYDALKSALAGTGIEAAAGQNALVEAATRQADWVMAGIVGIAGLEPTRAAIRNGSTIALANKECLVCAGEMFLAECERSGTELLPVDSEHNAIFQVFEERNRAGIERIILTASGGPFRTWSTEQMVGATPKSAASHPNWDMGIKISIDSATMFNKALEMIEARHLFAMPPDAIEVVVHPQSVIHSMVGYQDGSVLAQLGSPDMRTAIGYALAWPVRGHVPVERLDFTKLSRLDFEAPDEKRFPAIRLARNAMQAGGLAGTVLNGAKEAALEAFIEGRIGFLDIASLVERTLDDFDFTHSELSIEAVRDADRRSRSMVHQSMAAA
ncbi:MAG: 1-deoxy-D-xylulose-5-phosphate reductoisomerase [Pseudomonadota bacterium]